MLTQKFSPMNLMFSQLLPKLLFFRGLVLPEPVCYLFDFRVFHENNFVYPPPFSPSLHAGRGTGGGYVSTKNYNSRR